MRRARVVHRLLVLATAVAGSQCAQEPPARAYELEGQILTIRAEPGEVLIKHGDIVGFMPGMTMPFKVRDARLLADKAPGDLVRARLMVAPGEAWLDSLDTIGHAPLEAPATMPAASFITPLAPGDRVPDTTLTDQSANPVTLQHWPGSALVVTFVYLRCPLPEFCPLMDRRFVELQRGILADASLTGRARLLSISFDPESDTPAAMTSHATRVGARPDTWRFATAPPESVDRLAAQFGVNVIREADRSITHNLRTAVIGPDGRVASLHDGSTWTADDLLDALRQTLPAASAR